MQLKRKFYLEKIEKYINKPIIKVITGQRRVGKTTFLKQLATKFSDTAILYVDKENKDFDFLKDDDDLNIFLEKEIKNGKKYIFIDEIQNIVFWQKTINSVFSKYQEKVEIFISGSNSSLLSGELATLLTGRFVQFQIFPFSYEEFLEYFELKNKAKNFKKYMEIGGIPFVYKLDDEEIIRDFVKGIIDTIFIKDLVPRYNIKDVFLLKELFIFLLNNVGNLTNITNIVNYLKSVRIHTNYNTIASYIEVLKSAYLVYEANLLDLKGKRIFNRERKFYIGDHIFQKVFLSSTVLGIGKTLENIVYIMALRKGYNVFVGRLNNQEIDFVLEKNGKKIYLQVVYILVDEDVVKREFGNFDKIQDNWEKFVVSMDEVNFGVINGIKHIKVWELDEYI